MTVKMIILKYIILYHSMYVLGTVIDPQTIESSSTVQVHCLSSNEPIEIKDPFSKAWINDENFIAMEWYQRVPAETGKGTHDTLLLQFMPNRTKTVLAKFTIYDFWGLQINDASLDDSATYIAKLVHLDQGRELSFELVVATPPVLGSEHLSVSRAVNEDDQTVRLSCGYITSLGSPPVALLWKTESGTVLPAVYQDGYLLLILTPENDTGKYICEMDTDAPAAKCITENDVARFKGALVQSSKSESADMTGVIASVVAAILAAVAIIIIIVFCIMRRRRIKTEYNARKQEEKRDKERGQNNATSHLKDEEDSLERSLAPIYKGLISSETFMISKVSEGNTSLIFKPIKPQVAQPKDMVYLNGERSQPQQNSGKYDKQIEGKNKQKHDSQWSKEKCEENGQKEDVSKLPHINPGRICLTSSKEEQEKIGRTVNGGISNGVAISRGTLV